MVNFLSKTQPFFYLGILCFLVFSCRQGPEAGNGETVNISIGYQADTAKVNRLVEKALKEAKNNLNLGLKYGDSALVVSRQAGYVKGEADALFSKGWLYKRLKMNDSAIHYMQNARVHYNELQDTLGIINSNNVYGMLMRETGQYDSSYKAYMFSLKLSEKRNDSVKILKIHNLIGVLYGDQSLHDSSMKHYYIAGTIAQKLRNRSEEATINQNIAVCQEGLSRPKEARLYYRKCLDFYFEDDNALSVCEVYNGLANTYLSEKNFDSSFYYYMKSLQIAEEKGYNMLRARVFLNLFGLFDAKKEFEKANECLTKAFPIYRSLKDTLSLINCFNMTGLYFERKKQYSRSLQYYDTAMLLAQKMESRADILVLYNNIYWVYKYMKDYRNAMLYLEKHRDLKDSIFSDNMAKAVSELEIKYAREKDQGRILTLEKNNLEKDIAVRKARNRRDISLAGGGFVLLLALFTIAFFRQKARKDRAIAEQKLLKAEEEKKALAARSLVEGQEEERVRVARELHDGIGMLISTTIRQFEAAAGPRGADPELILRAKAGMEKANEDVRRISRNLMPTVLSLYGLEEALDDLIEGLGNIDGIYAAFHSDDSYERMPLNREIMIYRIVQELINNTVKHAGAESVLLKMERQDGNLVVTYSDDGRGFDYNEKLKAKSVGLKSIQSRLDFLGGALEVESAPGKGSMFRLKVPLETGGEG